MSSEQARHRHIGVVRLGWEVNEGAGSAGFSFSVCTKELIWRPGNTSERKETVWYNRLLPGWGRESAWAYL